MRHLPCRLLFLCLLAFLSACSGDDNQSPVAPAPIPNYTGVWTGTYTVTACTQNGDITLANVCGTFPAGTNLQFQLNLIQQGSQIIQGTFTLGTVPFTVVPATLTANGAVVVSGSTLMDGLTILVTWNLVTPITGTQTQVWSAAGLTGQVNISSNIGSVVKTGSIERGVQPTSRGALIDGIRQ